MLKTNVCSNAFSPSTTHLYAVRATYRGVVSRYRIWSTPERISDEVLSHWGKDGEKLEWCLLGEGPARLVLAYYPRIDGRHFHTQKQVDDYLAGYSDQASQAQFEAVDGMASLGYLDKDTENNYRQAAHAAKSAQNAER